jgi:phosphoribosyl 1,2-cyclic phosphodiesterase
MALRICVLVSGSSGNCTYVASASTAVLVDAGLSCRETLKRLGAIGVDPANVRAVCLTHEHDDHISSLGALHRRLGAEIYANGGTIDGVSRDEKAAKLRWNVFATGVQFVVGDLRIEPFSVPHDAYDPVGFVVSSGASRVGIVTDMGMVTELIRQKLRNCQVVVIEANHDEVLLKDSQRPWSLKQRIAGRQGHLSNEQAAGLVADIAGPGLKAVFLAHLSGECNRPELAVKAIREALKKRSCESVAVNLTYVERPSDVAEC